MQCITSVLKFFVMHNDGHKSSIIHRDKKICYVSWVYLIFFCYLQESNVAYDTQCLQKKMSSKWTFDAILLTSITMNELTDLDSSRLELLHGGCLYWHNHVKMLIFMAMN